MVPIFIWFAWLSTQKNFARIFSVSTNIWADLSPFRTEFIGVVWSWIPLSDQFPTTSYNYQKAILILLLMITMITVMVSIIRIKKNDLQNHLMERQLRFCFILIAFIISYAFVLVLAYLTALPRPDIDTRMLLPVELAFLLIIFILISFFRNTWSHVRGVNILNILALVFLVSSFPATIELTTKFHLFGYGYTSKYWRNSQMIKAVQGLSPEIALISNEAAVLLFYTGRPAYEIPELIYSESLSEEFTRFGEDPNDQAQKMFKNNNAALVLFDSIYYQFEKLDDTHPQERLDAFIQGMNVFADYADGTIYFYNPTAP
jgi:hypothetical protein